MANAAIDEGNMKTMQCTEDEPTYPAAKAPLRCKKFYCKGCKLWQPWCCGAVDEHADLCDICAAKVIS